MVRWKTSQDPLVPPRAVCSWHGLGELECALYHVQTYIETRPRSAASEGNGFVAVNGPLSRKRKSPGSGAPLSRDSGTPILRDLAHLSREASVISLGSSSNGSEPASEPVWVYNGVLQRREGRITLKKTVSKKVGTPHLCVQLH